MKDAPPLETDLPLTEAFEAEYLAYNKIFPLGFADERLRVAVSGVPVPEALLDLETSYDCPVELVHVEDEELQEAVRRTFTAAASVVDLVRDLEAVVTVDDEGFEDLRADVRDLANQPPVIRFVNLLIREAYDSRASDVHLESARDGMHVRFRVDGVLSDAPAPPARLQAAVISRVKLLAELDIAERRVPQDGRLRIRLEDRELDIRVSTVPTLGGESVVLRLLDRGDRPVGVEELGMPPEVHARFKRCAQKSHGIVLATGPTGSGKTTTLYAALGLRDPSSEKTITIEDPVEYHLPHVTQVPINAKAGLTFAAALRSMLRQDPDVLMVGEMRDPETAAIAVQASITGHLVFSTVHTNDAVSAVARLVDLDVEPYMIAATVEGVLAQRLVRKICPECRESYTPEPSTLAMLSPVVAHDMRFERGRGCAACRNTGFRGRTGIFELLEITDGLRHALLKTPDVTALREVAAAQGMRTLREDGWRKVRAGMTTPEEVLRVIQD